MSKPKNTKVKGFFEEFKTFALKGNIVDLAIGIIIGGAFTKIVNALVESVFMPVLGLLIGGIQISSWTIELPSFFKNQQAVNTLPVGVLLQSIIEFVLIAFCLFLLVKLINRLRSKQEPAKPDTPPPPTETEKLLTEIRDCLQEKQG